MIKVEERTFKNEKGEQVNYSIARILDNDGNVFDVSVPHDKLDYAQNLAEVREPKEVVLNIISDKNNRPKIKLG